MTAPNAAGKSPSKMPEKKTQDLRPQLARRKSQDAQSKVAAWNATVEPSQEVEVPAVEEVEAVAEFNDEPAAVPGEKAVNGASSSPKTPASGSKGVIKNSSSWKGSRAIDFEQKAWVRRRSKPAEKVPAEVKEATTPKKRVVSDNHWRRDHQTPRKESPTPEKKKDSAPKPITIRRSVATVGLKMPPSVQTFVETEAQPRRSQLPDRVTRSRSPSSGDEAGRRDPDFESSGVKVYIKKRPAESRKASNNSDSRGKSSPLDRTGSGTRHQDDSPRPSIHQSKVIARKPLPAEREPPRPVPRVFGNRVEGWLSAMPEDPFSERSVVLPPSEPGDIERRKSRRTVRDRVEDVENEEPAYEDRFRRRRSRPGLEPIDSNERSRPRRNSDDRRSDASPSPPRTLKRSGARRSATSPVKAREGHRSSSLHEMSGALPAAKPSNSKPFATTQLVRPVTSANSQPSLNDARGARDLVHRREAYDDHDASHVSDGDEPISTGNGLKRRTTKHSDLMSVLSLTQDEVVANPRSSKSKKVKHGQLTIGELMNELTTDELTYQRELRTLVDGVIPVLLNYVLKHTSQPTPGSAQKPLSANTQPIVDMGVSLERLKAVHKRIPMHDPDKFLSWADDASKVYAGYLRVWRLGFHNLVVSLAPADEDARRARAGPELEHHVKDSASDAKSERVDVAFLLKRPLVRLKGLKKTLGLFDQVLPSHQAKDLSQRYQQLLADARQRAHEERARLEDEAAASIDPTRARDLESLAPLSGVSIDASRSVRARDYFDLQLYHSSGQQFDCKIEIILRDDFSGRGNAGDVLFCEISTTGRWLLFPPILSHLVSARAGEKDGEIVVMARGILSSGKEWREIMCLRAASEQCTDWTAMLGTDPVPPRLTRQSSFNTLRPRSGTLPPAPLSELTEDVQLPIGERAKATARKWDGSDVNSAVGNSGHPRRAHFLPESVSIVSGDTQRQQVWARYETDVDARDYYDDRKPNGRYRPSSDSRLPLTRTESDFSTCSASTDKSYSVWLPSSDRRLSSESVDDIDEYYSEPRYRPSIRRRRSSVPSDDLPSIPKLRKAPEEEAPHRRPSHRRAESSPLAMEPKSSSSPGLLQRFFPSSKAEGMRMSDRPALPTSQPSNSMSQGPRSGPIPSFTPAFLRRSRRSSSPLKKEYNPSTVTESSYDSGISDSESELSITSHSSAEEVQEAASTLGDLKDFGKFGARRFVRPRDSPSGDDGESLRPSDSASQAPFRKVPHTVSNASAKTVACIFSWSNQGAWDSLHPQECEIVVTPGLIEAFDLAQANQVSPNSADPAEPSPSQRGVKPLVALELTPLVPLRRGTAVDISIRSPLTPNSLLRAGNNIMFRSRNPEECEKLYSFINRARIDNPTWIALQNARGPVPTSNWAEVMDRRNEERNTTSGSNWLKSLSRKGSTYRSAGTRAVSTAATESSIGTINTAFSALRRFSGSNRIFNIGKSTITSRQGRTRSTGSDSLDSGPVPTPIVGFDPSMGTPIGITDAKIRLWLRESASKWRDLGSARLTVLLPPRQDPVGPANPAGLVGAEKRVLVTGKSRGETMLDVTLHESAFERVARTGIAVSVVEEVGQIGSTGGVLAATAKVFMMQMKSERDAAYTFSMVGKLRY